MLSYKTVESDTLELLRGLMAEPLLAETRKDFVDIYFLLKKYTLSEILAFYELKYPEHSQFRALMSLSYFEDAEQQPMPKMFMTAKWEDIKKSILQEITKLSSL